MSSYHTNEHTDEHTDEPEVLTDTEDLSAKLDTVLHKLEIIRVTTKFMLDVLGIYIGYRAGRWVMRRWVHRRY